MRLRARWLPGLLVLMIAALALGGPSRRASAEVRVCGGNQGDFNGDGRTDLAIGVAHDRVGTKGSAGAVNVLYGTGAGLSATGNQLWTQDSAGIVGAAEVGDSFGKAVAVGDFNGDGFDDLAAAAPHEDVGSIMDAGAVNVIYGSAGGLRSAGNQIWDQAAGIADSPEQFDYFGLSLVACDFNGDGRDDLAVGVPDENFTADLQGAVHVIYGSGSGLNASGSQYWNQNSAGIGDSVEQDDRFGSTLAAGDFNGNGRADLAVGVPHEDLPGGFNAGAVNVIYGTSAGLSSTGSQFWTQDTAGVADAAEQSDRFGWALAVGDFNGNGRPDLAVAAAFETLDASTQGAVHVIFGSTGGLTSTGSQFWSQDSTGIADSGEAGDNWGRTLAAGDFDGNGRSDLAVGVPFENLSAFGQGAVNVIYGSAGGLTSTGSQFWNQNTAGIADSSELNDQFGSALSAGDFKGSARDGLAVGVQGEDLNASEQGAVHVLYGVAGGLSSTGSQFWNQDTPGIAGSGESDDIYGSALVGNAFDCC